MIAHPKKKRRQLTAKMRELADKIGYLKECLKSTKLQQANSPQELTAQQGAASDLYQAYRSMTKSERNPQGWAHRSFR